MASSTSTPCADQAEFPARLAMLPATAAFARAFCDRHGIARNDALRLTLVIEELFSNTVRHGYGVESEAPIGLTLGVHEGLITLLYEDRAPRFDPLASMAAPPASLTEPIERRPVGGLGVHLLGRLVQGARYSYEDGSNRLWLTLAQGD
jgi:serine/threonine-protein kinase RsbW